MRDDDDRAVNLVLKDDMVVNLVPKDDTVVNLVPKDDMLVNLVPKDDMLVNLYPQKMDLSFASGQVKADLSSFGGYVGSQFIVDNNTRRFTQVLKTPNDLYVMNLNEQGTKDMLAQMPEMKIRTTDEMDTLAGFVCRKSIADFESDSVPPIVLWHTNEIKLESPNWWNQFHDCPEFLLGYDIEQYGLRMRVRATSVKMAHVPDEVFMPPANATEVDLSGMQEQIEGLIEQFQQ